jgi:hypothetical protein
MFTPFDFSMEVRSVNARVKLSGLPHEYEADPPEMRDKPPALRAGTSVTHAGLPHTSGQVCGDIRNINHRQAADRFKGMILLLAVDN